MTPNPRLYQMVQRCFSRFRCRASWVVSISSSSFFTTGGDWMSSLAMNSLGGQTGWHHGEKREEGRPEVRREETRGRNTQSPAPLPFPAHCKVASPWDTEEREKSAGERKAGREDKTDHASEVLPLTALDQQARVWWES